MSNVIDFTEAKEKKQTLDENFDEIERILDPENEYRKKIIEFGEKYNTIDKALTKLDDDFLTLIANITLLTNILIRDMEKRKINFLKLEEFRNIISINTQLSNLMIDHHSDFETLMKIVDYDKEDINE